MCPLQDVKQSGFEAALLVDPVNDVAIGGVAADGVAQQLAYAGIIILFNGNQQFRQPSLEHIPGQMILVGTHDHRMLVPPRCRQSTTLHTASRRAQTGELDRNVALQDFCPSARSNPTGESSSPPAR
jgi:hypothetical protein